MTLDQIEKLARLMESLGIGQLSYADGANRIAMKLGGRAAKQTPPPGNAKLDVAPAVETLSTVSMGWLSFAHPGRSDVSASENAGVVAGQVVAYVVDGPVMTAVAAPHSGRLGRALRSEAELVGYGTPVFEFTRNN